jgi:hypothetical protein
MPAKGAHRREGADASADPAYLKAFATIMSRVERGLGAQSPAMPVSACVVAAPRFIFIQVCEYQRTSTPAHGARPARSNDLQVAYRDKDGHARLLYFNTQYNDSFALLHHDAYDDAAPIQLEGVDAHRLIVKLLTPLDLAVSKLARFSQQDQLDIRTLARERLFTATRLRRRAQRRCRTT